MEETREKAFLILVGRNVRRVRKEKNISMETLAHEADIEYRQLGRIERGEINTGILSLYVIADILRVNINEFFLSWFASFCLQLAYG